MKIYTLTVVVEMFGGYDPETDALDGYPQFNRDLFNRDLFNRACGLVRP